MNRLLIQTNGDAYPQAALPSSSSSSATGAVNGSGSCEGGSNDVRRLQDEVNQLTKRNGGKYKIPIATSNHHLLFKLRNCNLFLSNRVDAATRASRAAEQRNVCTHEKGL